MIRPSLFAACLLVSCTATPDNLADAGATSAPQVQRCEPSPERCDAMSAERPGLLSEHSAVYVPERMEMILFGGVDSVPDDCNFGGPVSFTGETWVYDDPCGRWQKLDDPGPGASGRHMATYGDGQMWVFGGRYRAPEAASGDYQVFPDLLRFDVEQRSWHGVQPQGDMPERRVNGALVWDDKRERLWLFGGNKSASGASYTPLEDLWSFDPVTSRWEEHRATGPGPEARLFVSAFYDGNRDRMVVYGGADASGFLPDAGYFGDLWSLDLDSLTWQLLHPGGGGGPQGRFWPGMIHDPASDTYLLFGGHDDAQLGNRNDTWRYDPMGDRWVSDQVGDTFNRPANDVCDFPSDFTNVDRSQPERRSAHTLVWSAPCGHAILFGGKTDCGSINDLWTYDGSWERQLEAPVGQVCLRGRNPERCASLCL